MFGRIGSSSVWTKYWPIPSMDKTVCPTDEHFLKCSPNHSRWMPWKIQFVWKHIFFFSIFHFFIFYPSKHFQNVEVSPLGTAKTANSTSYIQSHHHRIHGKIQKHGCYFHLFLSSSIPICNSSTTHIARYFSSYYYSFLCRPKFLNLTPLAIFMAAKCQILLIFFIFLDYNYNVFSG